MLEACAGLETRAVAGTAPPHGAGLFELSGLMPAAATLHVAALGSSLCRLVDPSEIAEPCGSGLLRVAAANDESLVCDADQAAATQVALSFDALGLRLLALDCAPCAELSLAAFLGEQRRTCDSDVELPGSNARTELRGGGARDALHRSEGQMDPLAAVSVSPDYEDVAVAMGARLVVPVGLALAHLGWLGDV